MVSPMEVNNRSSLADKTCRPPPGAMTGSDARKLLVSTGDLSRDLGEIGLATLGKRSEGFARLAGL